MCYTRPDIGQHPTDIRSTHDRRPVDVWIQRLAYIFFLRSEYVSYIRPDIGRYVSDESQMHDVRADFICELKLTRCPSDTYKCLNILRRSADVLPMPGRCWSNMSETRQNT